MTHHYEELKVSMNLLVQDHVVIIQLLESLELKPDDCIRIEEDLFKGIKVTILRKELDR